MAEKLTKQIASTDKKVEDLSKATVVGQKYKKLISFPNVLVDNTTEAFGISDATSINLVTIGGPDWFDGEFLLDTDEELNDGTAIYQILDTSDLLGNEFKEWHIIKPDTMTTGSSATIHYSQLNNVSTRGYQDLKLLYINTSKQIVEVQRDVRIVSEGNIDVDFVTTGAKYYFLGIYSDSYTYSLGPIPNKQPYIYEYPAIRLNDKQIVIESEDLGSRVVNSGTTFNFKYKDIVADVNNFKNHNLLISYPDLHITSVKFMGRAEYNPYTISIKRNDTVLAQKTVNAINNQIVKAVFNLDANFPNTDDLKIESDKPLVMNEVIIPSKVYPDTKFEGYGMNICSPTGMFGSTFPFTETTTTANEYGVISDPLPYTFYSGWEYTWDIKYCEVPMEQYRLYGTNTGGWILYGFDTRTGLWDTLDDQRNSSWSIFDTQGLAIASTKPYLKYKIKFYGSGSLSNATFYVRSTTVSQWRMYEPDFIIFGWNDADENHNNGWIYTADTNSTSIKTGIIDWEATNIYNGVSTLRCFVEFSDDNITYTSPIEKTNGQYITDAELGAKRYARITIKLDDPEGSEFDTEESIWVTNVRFRYREVI